VKEHASVRDDDDCLELSKEVDCRRSNGKPRNPFKTPEEEFNVKINEDYLVSPYNAPDEILAQFPPTKFVTASFDPFLDECLEFAKKLKRNGVEVTFDILKDLPHGFLYFSQVKTNIMIDCSSKQNQMTLVNSCFCLFSAFYRM
jgi:acetyl esterase/lipase